MFCDKKLIDNRFYDLYSDSIYLVHLDIFTGKHTGFSHKWMVFT